MAEVSKEEILRALADGPKRPSEIRLFLKLPEWRAGATARDPRVVDEIGKELQALRTEGRVQYAKGRWAASNMVTLTVQVPAESEWALREWVGRLEGNVLRRGGGL